MAIDPNNLSSATLTFNDDFNSFDTATWGTAYPWGGETGNTNEGNNEEQWYLNAGYASAQGLNTYDAHDGVLDINANPTPSDMMGDTQDHPYTSGLINTQGTFSQTYGYFEMRASLPAGQGVWPAFWLLNEEGGWPPELDVIETIGSDPDTANMTVHTAVGGHSMDATEATIPGLTGDGQFHTYGVDWQSDEITWYIDGNEVFQSATPSDMHDPMYMLANLAIGGDWPGSPDGSTEFPSTMSIDYIRAYSDDPNAQAVAPGDSSVAPDAGNGGATGSGQASGEVPGGTVTAPGTGSAGNGSNGTPAGSQGGSVADGSDASGTDGRGQHGTHGQHGSDSAQAGAGTVTDGGTEGEGASPQDGDTASAGPDAGAADPDATGSIGGQDGAGDGSADDAGADAGATGSGEGGWGRGDGNGWHGRHGSHGRHEGRGHDGDASAGNHQGHDHDHGRWHGADGHGSGNGPTAGSDAAPADPETTGSIGIPGAPSADGTGPGTADAGTGIVAEVGSQDPGATPGAAVTDPAGPAGGGTPVEAGTTTGAGAAPALPTGATGTSADAGSTDGHGHGGCFDFSHLLNPSQGGAQDVGHGTGGTWSHLLQDAVGAANGSADAFAHGGWQSLLQDVLSRCGGSAGHHDAADAADAGAVPDADAHLDLSALHGAQDHAAQMLHA